MRRRRRRSENRIKILFGAVLVAFLSVCAIRSTFVSAIALEQTARCGAEEHIHSEECYTDGTLCCGKMAHMHTENCYLVLLRDNDINHLLTQVEGDPSNSLEPVIQQTLDSAVLQYRSTSSAQAVPLAAGEDTGGEFGGLSISELNRSITENEIEPGLVLNEDLYKAGAVADGPTDTIVLNADLSTAEEGIMPLALGAEANTSRGYANIYVNVDNSWQCIGSVNISTGNNGWRYYARIDTAETLNLVNGELGTSLTQNNITVEYNSSSANAAESSWLEGSVGSSNITLGNSHTSRNEARNAKYVRILDSSGSPMRFYTVAFNYADGTSRTQYVRANTAITLPAGHTWQDDAGNLYEGGQEAVITTKTTFTETEGDGSIRILYQLNFPTVSGVTVSTKPTLQGTALQTVTDTVEEGSNALVRNVSQQEVIGKVNNHDANLSRVIRFSGWQVGNTDTIISANATLTWEELQAYATGGRITLTAVWETNAVQTASFYVRYDSVAMDTSGTQIEGVVTDYTPELFATHVGGEDADTMSYSQLNSKYYIADTSSDNSYGADQAIRARYGEQSGIWLQSFPRDEDIFEQLKAYADKLEVDGKPVDVNDLNENAYTIRWYVMKCQSDAWHIDGRLVKKEGIMHITKTFAGNREGIAAAKEDFRITAVNDDGTKSRIMTLTNYDSYSSDTDTYAWEITGVEYNEPWTVTEYTYGTQSDAETTYDSYAAYNVVDVFNLDNNKVGDDADGDGILAVDVVGQTYATDAGAVQVLRVEYTNIYHSTDSIIIKKEDSKTGNALGGATFQLLQNDAVMHFTYDSAKDQYIYDPSGSIEELSGSRSGYYEIMTTGFSYDDGDVTVKEMLAPEGYTPIENIVVGERMDGTIGILNDSPMASYHNGLLIIENTTESTSVTAVKEWLCPESEWTDEVTVQLLANGNLASALIPGVETTAVLSASGGWTHTWTNLPTHANGAEISWSVRETRIGSEPCRQDFTFANWLVFYSDPVLTTDDSGKVTNVRITVQNETRRTLLRLVKTDTSNIFRLSGATFTLQHLQQVNGVYADNPDFVTRTMTTGADGTLTFDNLLYGRYRLTETKAPDGYELLGEPIYLTLGENGAVTVDGHEFAQADSTAYSIRVINRAPLPLPSTGGSGTAWYHTIGGVLMLLALCGYILPKTTSRRKGGYPN